MVDKCSRCYVWRGDVLAQLVMTDLLYKLLTFVLLTPLLAMLFRTLLALSGNSVLSDVDIAVFFAGPFGWFCAIVLGAVWLGIVALEQASLLWILAERSKGNRAPVLASLSFAAGQVSPVLRVTGRLIAWSLVVIGPFLLIAGGVYFGLLTDYDINYYLAERPLEFKIAIGVGLGLATLLIGILLRLYSGWFLALPLVLFGHAIPRRALRESQQLVAGYRYRVVTWLILWAGSVVVANLLVTAMIGGAGRLLIPASVGSLAVLATRIGLMLLILALASLIVNLIATIGFASMLFQGYRRIDPNAAKALVESPGMESPDLKRIPLLTRGRLLVAGVVGALLAAVIGYGAFATIRLEDDVDIMAHRGASQVAPENTMAAFRQAIDDGADWIEIECAGDGGR